VPTDLSTKGGEIKTEKGANGSQPKGKKVKTEKGANGSESQRL
jgi:hypothetical protein